MTPSWFHERLYPAVAQSIRLDKPLFQTKTAFQELQIFHNETLGHVMTLDGVVQTTQADEYFYHEMMAHPAILAHGAVKSVLIIGGGDGGILREVAKHRSVESITLVEIDSAVIEMAKKYFPAHSAGAFDDPRLNLVIDDGLAFVEKNSDTFDLILSDTTDPEGPGELLFSSRFYTHCYQRLRPNGIMINQNGVYFMQLEEALTTRRRLKPIFKHPRFYRVAIPTYAWGDMLLSWACDLDFSDLSLATLAKRYQQSGIQTRYYNPAMHLAAFALPNDLLQALNQI
jgi:spermidine synthase